MDSIAVRCRLSRGGTGIIFETSFENKQLGHETVISKREKDGSWRIAGYYIK